MGRPAALSHHVGQTDPICWIFAASSERRNVRPGLDMWRASCSHGDVFMPVPSGLRRGHVGSLPL